MEKLSKWAIKRVSRSESIQVDALARISAIFPMKEAVLLPVYLQNAPSIAIASMCTTNEVGVD